MSRSEAVSRQATLVMELIGMQVAQARRAQRRTAADIAERAGISRPTLRRIENGDPAVAAGTVFEVAALLGVPLFAEPDRLETLAQRERARLALLPSRVHVPTPEFDDDF